MLYLRKPQPSDEKTIRSLFQQSTDLHRPWTYPPENYSVYLAEQHRYFLCLYKTDEIIGVFTLSGVIRGFFQSAYLGYEVFSPFQGRGYMSKGIQLIVEEAFCQLKLHRLEANIQPGNTRSIALVSRAGFVKEGYSKHYLNIGGYGWQDHERWAIINEHWGE